MAGTHRHGLDLLEAGAAGMRRVITVGAILAGVAVVVLAVVIAVAVATAPGPDAAVLVDGESRTSSSGQYTAEFFSEDSDGQHLVYPVIKDRAGIVVWSDDERYLQSAHPVGVIWQEDADVLWLLSSDIGNSRVVQVDGEWTKDRDQATLPPDIAEIEGGR